MKSKATIVWFRRDLRIHDNPALFEAANMGPVIPVYILDDKTIKSASKVWLHHSLTALNKSLNNNLNIYHGETETILRRLVSANNVNVVFWNYCYEPQELKKDKLLEAMLESKGATARIFNGSLLWEPSEISKDDGSFYQVFTPFYKRARSPEHCPRAPLGKPKKIVTLKDDENHTRIDDLNLLPKVQWHRRIEKSWNIGEKSASKQLQSFIENDLSEYRKNRDFPFLSTSRLSPYLHFGEISPHQIWSAITTMAPINSLERDGESFLRELVWREFCYGLLHQFPKLQTRNFRDKFDRFPWIYDQKLLRAWQKGQTGYPLVDAGMRELWHTGFMHNRVRMVTASFLIKNLLIDWREGEKWFFDCLVDADMANNSANWQWVAGSGADAAPFFRVFNPTLQGEKFDHEGSYTRKFVPELKDLSSKYLFRPWAAPDNVLKSAGVVLGKTYPFPIVDQRESHNRALAAYKTLS